MAKAGFFRSLLRDGLADATIQGIVWLLGVGSPIVVAAVTAAVGQMQGLPIAYIIAATAIAFAMTATGLLRFEEWRAKRRTQDKLRFETILLARSASQQNGILVGFRFNSGADFPIEFRLDQIRTRIGDKVPSLSTFSGATQFVVPPNGSGWFWDNMIIVTDAPKEASLEGFIEFEATYGRVGNLKYPMRGKKQVIVGFNKDGIFAGGNWHEAV